MNSLSNVTYEPLPEISHEPLEPGTYYLVDIEDAVREYLRTPQEIRMVGVSEGAPYSDVDMLDIELASLIPCLDIKQTAHEELREHVADLLEDGQEQIKYQLETQGVNTETRTIVNTHEQLEHAKVIDNFGGRLYDALVQAHLYNERGQLLGEHVTITDGVLVLRAT